MSRRVVRILVVSIVAALSGAAHGREHARTMARDAKLQAAFKAAFGTTNEAVRDGKDASYDYEPYRLLRLGGSWVLLSKASTSSCHACSGSLAVHYLRSGPRGFEVIGAWPELAGSSSNGDPPDVAVRRDLFDGPALVLGGGWSGQGCESEWVDLVELRPDRPVVRATGLRMEHRLMINWMTSSMEDKWGRKLQGHIRPLERGRSFAIDYTGRRRLTVRYRLGRDGTYRAAGKDPHVPNC